MAETQSIAPDGIEPRPMEFRCWQNEANCQRRLSELVHHPYFQRFCEDRRRPMGSNDSLQHARSVYAASVGVYTVVMAEFLGWCGEKGYELE